MPPLSFFTHFLCVKSGTCFKDLKEGRGKKRKWVRAGGGIVKKKDTGRLFFPKDQGFKSPESLYN